MANEHANGTGGSLVSPHDLLETLRETVFQIDWDGRWAYLNAAWEALSGYRVAECVGRPCLDFVHQADLEIGRASWRERV